jgi:hypothetical protein
METCDKTADMGRLHCIVRVFGVGPNKNTKGATFTIDPLRKRGYFHGVMKNDLLSQHCIKTCEKIEIVKSEGFASTKRGEFAKTGFEIVVEGEMESIGNLSGGHIRKTVASGFRDEAHAKVWAKRKGLAA